MTVDWGLAAQIGAIGFVLVFAVLAVLAVAVWVVALVLHRIAAGKGETEEQKKGE